MKKRKKETLKSILLVFLILSSLILSYLTTTYKPDYEIFTRKIGKKIENTDNKNLLNFVTPDTIVKTEAGAYEEQIVPNSITKLAKVDAVKDKKILKEILMEISKSESIEARVRNKDVEELSSNDLEKLTINYPVSLDSALVKSLFFSEESSNVNLEFDTIAVLKDRPNILYLYKKGDKNYLQINLKEDIYNKIIDIFNENKQEYTKYSLNNKFIYLKDSLESQTIDEYSAEDINLTKLAKDIFTKKDNLKISGDTYNSEVTDGYSILKYQGNKIVYANPSNENGSILAGVETTNIINFLELGYVSDVNYQIITIIDGVTILQEVYKESIVFSREGYADITVEDNSNGIYRVTLPKKIRKTYLSSKNIELYDIEKIEYIINYLYKYTDLKNVQDIVLGYDKKYNKENNSFSYTPTWYIKYNNRYVSFKKLKESIEKGVQL